MMFKNMPKLYGSVMSRVRYPLYSMQHSTMASNIKQMADLSKLVPNFDPNTQRIIPQARTTKPLHAKPVDSQIKEKRIDVSEDLSKNASKPPPVIEMKNERVE